MKLLISLFILSSVTFGQVDSIKLFRSELDEQLRLIEKISEGFTVLEKVLTEYNKRIEQLEARIKGLEDKLRPYTTEDTNDNYIIYYDHPFDPYAPLMLTPEQAREWGLK